MARREDDVADARERWLADVGWRLACARDVARLTQDELAEKLGLNVRTLQGVEAASTRPLRYVRPIAEITKVSEEWILYGETRVTLPDELSHALDHVLAAIDALVEHHGVTDAFHGHLSFRRSQRGANGDVAPTEES